MARKRDLQAVMACAVSGNLVTVDVVYEGKNEGLIRGREDAIQVALEAIVGDEQKCKAAATTQ